MTVTKRYNVPKFWLIGVKAKKYVVSPTTGPHSKHACVPLGVLLRDMLHVSHTMKESREILGREFVKVNGVVRKQHGFPVGMMDVVEIDGDFYRVLPSRKGLYLFRTDSKDGALRLARISNKIHVKGKKIQLSLHDGCNMLVDKDEFKTSDVVVVDVLHKIIKDNIKFEKGSFAMITDGHNAGFSGVIESIDRNLRTVTMTAGDRKVLVPIKYVFVVGRSQPAVNIGEA